MNPKSPINCPELVRQGEIARALNCSSTKVNRLANDEPTFPRFRRIGKQRYWLRSEIESWIEAQLNQAA